MTEAEFKNMINSRERKKRLLKILLSAARPAPGEKKSKV